MSAFGRKLTLIFLSKSGHKESDEFLVMLSYGVNQ
jgi:hypothetical protein